METVKTSLATCFIWTVYFLVICLLFLPSVSSSQPCEVISFEDKNVEIDFHGRKIAIIGWTHPQVKEKETADRFLIDALRAASAGRCNEVGTILSQASSELEDNFSNGNRVYRLLEEVNERWQIQSIGLEFSHVEMVDVNQQNSKTKNAIRRINNVCTDQRSQLTQFSKIYPGPAALFEYKLATSNINLIGVDSHRLKQETLSRLSPEVRNFDISDPENTSAARIVLNEILININNGLTVISEDQRQRLITTATSSRQKEFFEKLVDELNIVIELGLQRNGAIVSNIISTTGNIAIVMGGGHFEGIIAGLQKSCRNHPAGVSSSTTLIFERAGMPASN